VTHHSKFSRVAHIINLYKKKGVEIVVADWLGNEEVYYSEMASEK